MAPAAPRDGGAQASDCALSPLPLLVPATAPPILGPARLASTVGAAETGAATPGRPARALPAPAALPDEETVPVCGPAFPACPATTGFHAAEEEDAAALPGVEAGVVPMDADVGEEEGNAPCLELTGTEGACAVLPAPCCCGLVRIFTCPCTGPLELSVPRVGEGLRAFTVTATPPVTRLLVVLAVLAEPITTKAGAEGGATLTGDVGAATLVAFGAGTAFPASPALVPAGWAGAEEASRRIDTAPAKGGVVLPVEPPWG